MRAIFIFLIVPFLTYSSEPQSGHFIDLSSKVTVTHCNVSFVFEDVYDKFYHYESSTTTVEIFLSVKDDLIDAVSFDIDGCMNTNASAATVSMMAEGKDLKAAWKISEKDVIEYLETIPEQSHHCAELAVGAFYLALSDYLKKKKAGWR